MELIAALLHSPDVLFLDEPTIGLDVVAKERIRQFILHINRERGTTILLVEQNANMALSIANRGYVLQTGEIVLADTAQNLLNNPLMQKAYLGVA